MFKFSVTWTADEIYRTRKSGLTTSDGLYPDTVLWGVQVNGIFNPSVEAVLREIANAINEPDDDPRIAALKNIPMDAEDLYTGPNALRLHLKDVQHAVGSLVLYLWRKVVRRVEKA